jgi:hypothetical protein
MEIKGFVIPEGWTVEQVRFLLDVMFWLPLSIRDAYRERLAEQRRREEFWGCPYCGRIDPALRGREVPTDDTAEDGGVAEAGAPAVVDDDDIPY